MNNEQQTKKNSENKKEVKIKLHKGATAPSLATSGAAGYDLYVHSIAFLNGNKQVKYGTGVSVEIPSGYVGLLFPRSSVSKTGLRMSNSVGVIDSDYRGEISAVFDVSVHTTTYGDMLVEPTYNIGDRCCQLVLVPFLSVDFIEADTLSDTERGDGGYGSTGK